MVIKKTGLKILPKERLYNYDNIEAYLNIIKIIDKGQLDSLLIWKKYYTYDTILSI